ncbi:MAG: septal ring lytic transglycosylase RlpA family protein [Firmicutes bacterium]|nr:septal ring lytic transglycosylase RlpA family protein [Bacillota bacterium]
MAGEGVGARQARIGGRDVGEVVIHRRVVLRIRTSAGGLKPFDRAVLIAHRLADYLAKGYAPDGIFPDAYQGFIVVSWQGNLVVTVDAAHAGLNNTNEYQLAKVWANNMRRALDASPVPREQVLEGDSQEVVTAFCVASWYGEPFHGRPTANGETFDRHGLTAAHRYLPFGTKVRVTNLHNGKSVDVTINDRGPYVSGRAIDLSSGAAVAIGLKEQGIGSVKLEIASPSGRVL